MGSDVPKKEYNKKVNDLNEAESNLKKANESLNKEKEQVKKLELEKSKIKKDFEEKIQSIKNEKENEKQRLENEKLKYESDLKRREEEKKIKEKEEENKKEIKRFRDSQDIALFLELIEKYNDDLNYLEKILEALDEKEVVKKYEVFEYKIKGKIQIIRAVVYGEKKLSLNCERKLIIILLCIEKINNKCDDVLDNMYRLGSNKIELLFSVLLDYSKEFGKDVHFNNDEIYEKFVDYSFKEKKYLESLDYRSDDIIQLNILYEKRETIFKSYKMIDKIIKLNEYGEAHEIIQKIITYEKSKHKKFISFKRLFWENYYIFSKIEIDRDNNDNVCDKVKKLVKIYTLLLTYIDLGDDDTEFKETLAQKIHDFIFERLSEISLARNQLELLFKYDPYYTSSGYERNPEVFEKINILELNGEKDIEYLTNLNLENVYSEAFTKYLNVIIEKIVEIEDFNSIIKIIKINLKNNKKIYINLLSERYSKFPNENLTANSFINFIKKVLEYYPKIKLEILEKNLPRFGQKYKIYLKLFEIFKEDDEIKGKIAILSVNNLDLSMFIDLIKSMKDEEVKKDYFNNLSLNIIGYDDFLKLEGSYNLKLLMELMNNNLIPDSIYLDKNKKILQIIYDKLTTYDETNSKYIDTILNEAEEIEKIYSERFELFKLIKNDKYDSKSEFDKIKKKIF